jgi:multidrug efflux pump subunit AcrB
VSSIGWAESNAAEVDEPAPSAPAEPETLNVPPSAAGPRRDGAAPPPGIDSLLQLPAGFVPSSERTAVAGASEAEWRRRFRRTRGELDQARNALESTKRELDSVADEGGGSQWNVAPAVGGGNSPQGNSPISFKLRQELKRNRESVEKAEKALRQLQIEADLAGVPVAWREESESPSSGARKEFPTP